MALVEILACVRNRASKCECNQIGRAKVRMAAMSHSVPKSHLSLFPHASPPPRHGGFGLEIAAENHQIIDPRVLLFSSCPDLLGPLEQPFQPADCQDCLSMSRMHRSWVKRPGGMALQWPCPSLAGLAGSDGMGME